MLRRGAGERGRVAGIAGERLERLVRPGSGRRSPRQSASGSAPSRRGPARRTSVVPASSTSAAMTPAIRVESRTASGNSSARGGLGVSGSVRWSSSARRSPASSSGRHGERAAKRVVRASRRARRARARARIRAGSATSFTPRSAARGQRRVDAREGGEPPPVDELEPGSGAASLGVAVRLARPPVGPADETPVGGLAVEAGPVERPEHVDVLVRVDALRRRAEAPRVRRRAGQPVERRLVVDARPVEEQEGQAQRSRAGAGVPSRARPQRERRGRTPGRRPRGRARTPPFRDCRGRRRRRLAPPGRRTQRPRELRLDRRAARGSAAPGGGRVEACAGPRGQAATAGRRARKAASRRSLQLTAARSGSAGRPGSATASGWKRCASWRTPSASRGAGRE